jgi:transcriptional regulator with XRE-family HTH domain
MKDIIMNIGLEIKRMRKLKRLKQKELAGKVGVNFSLVSHWEAGRRLPGPKRLKKVCIILGIPEAELFTKDYQVSIRKNNDTPPKRKKRRQYDYFAEIGRLRKSQSVEIVVREFSKAGHIDIREYVNCEQYKGFSPKGLTVPIDLWEKFKQAVNEANKDDEN